MDPEEKGINHHKSQRSLETRVYVCHYLPTTQIYYLNYKNRPNSEPGDWNLGNAHFFCPVLKYFI